MGAPVVEAIAAWVDPIAALAAVEGCRRPVLLTSAMPDHPDARWSILAWDPVAEVTFRGGRAWMMRPGADPSAGSTSVAGDPFDLLRRLLPVDPSARAGDLPFAGGAIGYLGYGLRHAVERLPAGTPDPLDQPDGWFGFYDGAVVFDHADARVLLVAARADAADRDRRPAARLAEARNRVSGAAARPPIPSGPPPHVESFAATLRADYLDAVRRVLEHIDRGDLYQANLSHRLSCPLGEKPLDLLARLLARNPAPFAAYLDPGPFQVVSASPERFLSLRGDVARSSPIKGTRPRGGNEEEDRRLARHLSDSAKDRAENVMIADLVRNDLGKVCVPGSVRAEVLCGLQSFATVHHLVSTLSGRLRPDRDWVDLVRALFPGGSMTGAPKIRAMEVITALEREERGAYSGGIGYVSLDGDLDINIVIRTIVCGAGRAHLRVGGGIVADSDPQAEYVETFDKARALLGALGATAPPA
jgi:para-aminobenzoate synthetase component 1